MIKDIYGQGLTAFRDGKKDVVFTVESNIADTEEWTVSLFFRSYDEMPEIEKAALALAHGKILDVGAGAGSHALWLQDNGREVTALDISPGAVDVMRSRGISEAIEKDFFSYQGGKFDTILLLMNGIGITGRLEKLRLFFAQAKNLLEPDGKILLDSSDILYLFEEEDGSVMINLNSEYYGEIEYTFSFEGEEGEPFPWLFIDYDTLEEFAEIHGFSCRKIYEDDHYHYLAELRPIN